LGSRTSEKKLANHSGKEQILIPQQQKKPALKTRLASLCWKITAILVACGVIYALLPSRPNTTAQQAVARTRLALRQQGFKTDLADFDFSISPELQAREVILKATAPDRNSLPFTDPLNLMETAGNNSVIVVWKQDSLKRQSPSWPDNSDKLAWDEFRQIINQNQSQIDAACAAIRSGPIQFNLDASGGNHILLPHLAVMKNLTLLLNDRTMLALHDGNLDIAWTNLMAATRLVTAWKPEPAEVSQRVRFNDTKLVFDAIWQGLQTNGWTDEQLTRLQREWESADFFTNLPEIAAFKRASDVKESDYEQQGLRSHPPFDEFLHQVLRYPFSIWSNLHYRWRQDAYLRHGRSDDENALLLFYRDRELELRTAIQTPTWAQMRRLPGVTNAPSFRSKYPSRMQMMMNTREISRAIQSRGASLLGRAAETEARRRLIITAIALERYRGKNGSYPQTLAELAPEFLKTVPLDFMDGQPLRYRLTDGGHFMLYSVGLDCVDNGGKIQPHTGDQDFVRPLRPGMPLPESDLVWPVPATVADVQAVRQQEARAKELKNERQLEDESENEWNRSSLRQARVDKILATKWSPDAGRVSYQGRLVSDVIRNENVFGTNRPSLAELLTPKQVITGNEPEDLTFEFPVSYDAVTNMGFLLLLDADLDPGSLFAPDSGAKLQDRNRAPNGDCLLVWHTIFDPPRQHALQVEWTLTDTNGGEYWGKGPAMPVVTSNLCQFSLASAHFDPETGATFQAILPEQNGRYVIELNTTNGALLKTITGSTSNGVIKVHWDLIDDHGQRFTNDFFNSVFHITLPDSGRTQTLKGP
jgi:hypothetical protein